MKPKDLLGNEIKVGSTVAYASRCGNSAQLQVGEVLEIRENEERKRFNREAHQWLPMIELKIKGQGNSKAGWVNDTDRVVVLKGESD